MIGKWKKDMIYFITYKPDIEYYPGTNNIKLIEFKRNGKLHNIEFPANITYYMNGNIYSKEYYFKGKRHRPLESGPARIQYYSDGNTERESYYIDDKLHRLGGPAVITYEENGNIEHKSYCIEGKYHKSDGPAVIWYWDGIIFLEKYYIDGKHIIK